MNGENKGRQLDPVTLRRNLQRELVVKVNVIAQVLCFYFNICFSGTHYMSVTGNWKEKGALCSACSNPGEMGERDMLEVYFADNWQFLVMQVRG